MNLAFRMFPMMAPDDPGAGGGNPNPPADPKDPPQAVPFDQFKATEDRATAAETALKAFEAFGSTDELAAKLARFAELETSAADLRTRLEQAESKAQDTATALDRARIRFEFEKAATKENAVDADDLARFVNLDDFKVQEDGSIAGIAEAVEALKTSKPHLFASATKEPIGGGGMPPKQPKADLSKLSARQLMSTAFKN